MLFFIIFLIIPLIEISLFITIGEQIGLGTTLLLTVFTAITGSIILRRQGLKVLFEAQRTFSDGALPLRELFDGFCLTVAAICLITPGFFTDFIGFSLLFPPLRSLIWTLLPRFFAFDDVSAAHYSSSRESQIIDVNFERVDTGDDSGDESNDRP